MYDYSCLQRLLNSTHLSLAIFVFLSGWTYTLRCLFLCAIVYGTKQKTRSTLYTPTLFYTQV
jgi:hypothetical protein